MKTTVSIKIENRPKKNGECPVKLCIIRNRNDAYVPTGFYALPKNWDAARGLFKTHPDKTFANNSLTGILSKAQGILLKLDAEMPHANVTSIAKELRAIMSGGPEKKSGEDFFAFAEAYVNGTPEEEYKDRIPNFHTREHYNSSLAILKQYRPKLKFSEINYDFCVKFERSVRQHTESDNTVRGYFRDLRSLFNKAIKAGVCAKDLYPFGQWGYSIPPEGDTRHKALTAAQFATLATAELEGFDALARDTFVLQYYLMGARIGAVVRLEHANIQGDKIRYTAGKRKKIHEFTITAEASRIIESYKGGRFLLPFFDEWPSPEDVKKVTRLINDALERVCKKLGIPKVTSHQARHTFSRQMLDKEIHLLRMRDALGHSDAKTTQIYTGKISTSEMDELGKKVYE